MFKVGGKFRDWKTAHTLGASAEQDNQAMRQKISRKTKKTQKAIDQLSHELEVLSKQLEAEVAKRKAREAKR